MSFRHNAARRHRLPEARHRVRNRPAYEAGLRRRGDLTLWLEEAAIAGWHAPRRCGTETARPAVVSAGVEVRRARRSADRPRRFPGQLERLPMGPAVVSRALHAFGIRWRLSSDIGGLRRPAEPPRRRQEPHP